jgi:hypothetical protein
MEYVVDEAKGSVLMVQKGKAEPVTLEEEEEVQEGDEIITRENSQATLSLDENTLIRLGPDSDLRLSTLKPNESNGFISRLELVGGRILSEVEDLATSHSTFEIESGGVVCGVRGTEFEVQKQGQEVHTSTFKGRVEMSKGRLKKLVKANQHLAFSFRKKSFLGKRNMNADEKGTFQAWVAHKNIYQDKARNRRVMRETLNRMPAEQKSKILRQMKQAPARHRLKALRYATNRKKTPVSRPQTSKGHPVKSQLIQDRPKEKSDNKRPGKTGQAHLVPNKNFKAPNRNNPHLQNLAGQSPKAGSGGAKKQKNKKPFPDRHPNIHKDKKNKKQNENT